MRFSVGLFPFSKEGISVAKTRWGRDKERIKAKRVMDFIIVYSFEEKLVTNTRKVSLKPEKENI
jgi:hypothetical protein